MKNYVYVFVRMDIPRTQQTVQACHACVSAGREFGHSDDTSLILLQVENEKDLHTVVGHIQQKGIAMHIFYEPNYGPMGYTAAASGPVTEAMKDIFKGYKLWSSKPSFVRKLRRFTRVFCLNRRAPSGGTFSED